MGASSCRSCEFLASKVLLRGPALQAERRNLALWMEAAVTRLSDASMREWPGEIRASRPRVELLDAVEELLRTNAQFRAAAERAASTAHATALIQDPGLNGA
jgi:hypothetical protein